MRIHLTSLMVDDQARALAFYTEVLGFVKKADIPAGDYRWLTVVSPEAPTGIELTLEPNVFPPAKTFQHELFVAGIPYTEFAVDDLRAEFERLSAQGVRFTLPPTQTEGQLIAIFDDTCGNLIQLAQRQP